MVAGTIYENIPMNRVVFPKENLNFLAQQFKDKPLKEFKEYKNKLEKIAIKIGQNNKEILWGEKIVFDCLIYDHELRNAFTQENYLIKITKKEIITEITQSKIWRKEIQKYTKKLKKLYQKDIFEHKQEQNNLTYTDVKEFREINPHIIELIKENYETTKNYSKTARKFGLKDGRVTKKLLKEKSNNYNKYFVTNKDYKYTLKPAA